MAEKAAYAAFREEALARGLIRDIFPLVEQFVLPKKHHFLSFANSVGHHFHLAREDGYIYRQTELLAGGDLPSDYFLWRDKLCRASLVTVITNGGAEGFSISNHLHFHMLSGPDANKNWTFLPSMSIQLHKTINPHSPPCVVSFRALPLGDCICLKVCNTFGDVFYTYSPPLVSLFGGWHRGVRHVISGFSRHYLEQTPCSDGKVVGADGRGTFLVSTDASLLSFVPTGANAFEASAFPFLLELPPTILSVGEFHL